MRHDITALLCLLIFAGSTGRIHATAENSPREIHSAEAAPSPDAGEVLTAASGDLSNSGFSADPDYSSPDEAANWLMNRMVQMKSDAATADEDWAWMQAMGDSVAEYNVRIGRVMDRRASENMAMQDIKIHANRYGDGNQPELNIGAYVESVLSWYRTINMYDRLIMSVDRPSLKEALRREYAAWHDLIRTMDRFMCCYTYAGAYYSALPMDINATLEYWTCKRYEELTAEEAVLVYDKPFDDGVTAISLKRLDTLFMPFEHLEMVDIIAKLSSAFGSEEWIQERFGSCYDIPYIRKLAADIRAGIRDWATEREHIADMLAESRRESYEKLTGHMIRRFYVDMADLVELVY